MSKLSIIKFSFVFVIALFGVFWSVGSVYAAECPVGVEDNTLIENTEFVLTDFSLDANHNTLTITTTYSPEEYCNDGGVHASKGQATHSSTHGVAIDTQSSPIYTGGIAPPNQTFVSTYDVSGLSDGTYTNAIKHTALRTLGSTRVLNNSFTIARGGGDPGGAGSGGGPTQYDLQFTFSGTGGGSVTATPANGISNCSDSNQANCRGTYDDGDPVTITASADSGSKFDGWTGASDCTDGSLDMSDHRTCVANFSLDNSNDCSFTANLSADPTTVGINENVTFTASVSGANSNCVTGNNKKYRIDLTDNGSYEIDSGWISANSFVDSSESYAAVGNKTPKVLVEWRSNPNGTVSETDTASVTVENIPTVQMLIDVEQDGTFIDPAGDVEVDKNVPFDLDWVITNADGDCTTTVSPGGGSWPGTRGQNAGPEEQLSGIERTFTMECTNNDGGVASDAITVIVVPTVSLLIDVHQDGTFDDPTGEVLVGSSVPFDLKWEPTNAQDCEVVATPGHGGWGPADSEGGVRPANGGTETIQTANDRTFFITCSNGTREATDSIDVATTSGPIIELKARDGIENGPGVFPGNENFPLTISLGDQVDLKQQTAAGEAPDSCDASAVPSNSGWSGSRPGTHGLIEEDIDLTESTVFSLECIKGPLTDDSSVSVIVSGAGNSIRVFVTDENGDPLLGANATWDLTGLSPQSETGGSDDETYLNLASGNYILTVNSVPGYDVGNDVTILPEDSQFLGANDNIEFEIRVDTGGGGGSLACSPNSQTVDTNETATLNAFDGTGSYEWFIGGVSVGTGDSYTNSWPSPQTVTVELRDGVDTDICTIDVVEPPPFLYLVPGTDQEIIVGDPVQFTAWYNDGVGGTPDDDVTSLSAWASGEPAQVATTTTDGLFNGVAITDPAGVSITADYNPGSGPLTAFGTVIVEAPSECADGIDNDGDGGIDWNGGPGGEPADPHCIDEFDDNERMPPGFDNE